MNKRYNFMILALLTALELGLFTPVQILAHCQIPCGIYDDHARLKSLLEDTATIEKSMQMIQKLSGRQDAQSQNQLIRWVMNKEEHSQKVITTISDYYLTQRVKPKQKDYAVRLKRHHAVILAAMQTKQNTDEKYAVNLRHAIKALSEYYPEHKH